MNKYSLQQLRNFLHAQCCYQMLITPLPLRLPKEYQLLADRAYETFRKERQEVLHFYSPRHYVIHRFKSKEINAKKILLAHGWTSCAAHMVGIAKVLQQAGFDVYALDFPAHGEANGFQLTWLEAVSILQQILNDLGPFHGVIGHSFGGSMLFHLLNLSHQYSDWHLKFKPRRVIFLASPFCMRTPVRQLANQLKLNSNAYLILRKLIQQQSSVDIKRLSYRHFIKENSIPVLCIHGKKDKSIPAKESIFFCKNYPRASLALLNDIDHISILMNEKVNEKIISFLANKNGRISVHSNSKEVENSIFT